MEEDLLHNDPEEYIEDEEQGMFEHFRLNVDPGQEPMRVDKFMAARLEDTARHRVQCAIRMGYVLVNDKPAKANLIVRPGDMIKFVMPYRRRGVEILPEDIPLDIVFEDSDILVVNKPAGMVVHPGHGNYKGTLINALAFHLGLSQGPEAEDERMGSWSTGSTRTPPACWWWRRTMRRRSNWPSSFRTFHRTTLRSRGMGNLKKRKERSMETSAEILPTA